MRHYEPVSNANVRHGETHMTMSERPKRYRNGHEQPFPDRVHISFGAFGETFDYEVELMDQIFAPGAKLSLYRNGQLVEEAAPRLVSYWSKEENSHLVSFTLHDDGTTFEGMVARDGEIYHVLPTSRIPDYDADAHNVASLAADSEARGGKRMVVFRQRCVSVATFWLPPFSQLWFSARVFVASLRLMS